MTIENLMAALPENFSQVDRELIMRAYKFAEKMHEGQKRASGEPYITLAYIDVKYTLSGGENSRVGGKNCLVFVHTQ